ncbi:MAG: hypothetical protein Q9220_000196 [cf. Caloplaca sp. 1 TL-2023]
MRRLQQDISYTQEFEDEPKIPQPETLTRFSQVAEVSHPSLLHYCYHLYPKPNVNAPKRPLPAHILSSDSVQEEPREQAEPFSEASRLAGERWRGMSDPSRQDWKQMTSGSWNEYTADQLQYRNTESHRKHQAYLAKSKTAHPSQKRKISRDDVSGRFDDTAPSPSLPERSSPSLSAARLNPNFRRLAPVSNNPLTEPALLQPPESESNGQLESKLGLPDDPAEIQQKRSRVAPSSSHACEPCQKKKLKCDGVMPSCGRCRIADRSCFFVGGIRDKERRLAERLSDQLAKCESLLERIKPDLKPKYQRQVERLLFQSPPSKLTRNTTSAQASLTSTERQSEIFGDKLGHASGGESDASNVGSMGSTDHINEEAFAKTGDDSRIDSFLGQTATDVWVSSLVSNLTITDNDKLSEPDESLPIHNSYSRNGSENAPPRLDPSKSSKYISGKPPEPYELPPRGTADSFVSAYFSTVHALFPILDSADFTQRFEDLYSKRNEKKPPDPAFLTVLHLIFGIGAFYEYSTRQPTSTGNRLQLLDLAKAKSAVLDANIFDLQAYGQVQVCGLAGLYLLIMHRINSQKNHQLGIWFSVLSLERTISVITGRPSMVRDSDCTANLRPDGVLNPKAPINNSMLDTSHIVEGPTGGPKSFGLYPGHSQQKPSTTPDSKSFFQYVGLTSLADLALSRLYGAHIRHVKWSELQTTIEELDRKLTDLGTSLADVVPVDSRHQEADLGPVQTALGMLFHSTRIIINRPCLCRLDRRIINQSDRSNSFNGASAYRCVAAARDLLALLPTQPDPATIYRGALWWMGFHHLKRATAVVILELTFFSEHTPAGSEDILMDAKKGVNWLHAMGASSSAAYSSWITLSQILHHTVQKFGGDLSDVVIAEEQEGYPPLHEEATGVGHDDAASESTIATGSQSESAEQVSDFTLDEWDQFGSGRGPLLSSVSDLDKLLSQDGF